ncbi:MAG: SirB family protein [Lysobacteraceae bacterium]|nr:MAG: SirB family protein [Xanthomonadaceae bacterium]
MLAYYPQIKSLHVLFAVLSVSLFVFRGTVAVLLRRPWGDHPLLRGTSYLIDTLLLTFALMLLTMLHLNPFAQAWLAVKLGLLVVYIVLGALALRRAHRQPVRVVCFVAAILVAVWIFGVARAHHPLAWLAAMP